MENKERIAKLIVEYLENAHQNKRSHESAWVDGNDLTSVIIDGHVDMLELAGVVINAISNPYRDW